MATREMAKCSSSTYIEKRQFEEEANQMGGERGLRALYIILRRPPPAPNIERIAVMSQMREGIERRWSSSGSSSSKRQGTTTKQHSSHSGGFSIPPAEMPSLRLAVDSCRLADDVCIIASPPPPAWHWHGKQSIITTHTHTVDVLAAWRTSSVISANLSRSIHYRHQQVIITVMCLTKKKCPQHQHLRQADRHFVVAPHQFNPFIHSLHIAR